nr:MAG TPA: hypothetical protein [Bacteriophage sp.]
MNYSFQLSNQRCSFLLTLRKDRPYQRATSCAYAHTTFFELVYSFLIPLSVG